MVVLGRITRPCISFIQVLENSCDDLGLGDEGQDSKSAATGTEEWVGFVNSADQIGPTLSEGGTMFGSQLGLVSFCIAAISRCRFPIETAFFSQSTGSRGIGPVVVDIMFARLWDLGEDTSDELEDIEGLSVGMVEQAQGVVVCGLALVEEGACAFAGVDA